MHNANNIKLDLHVHTRYSADSSAKIDDIINLLKKNKTDKIAITDHNEIEGAKKAYEKMPNNIIIGEEILTVDGEIIGLFLQKKIKPYLTLESTIKEIKKQNGLIYIPHSFDRFRRGIGSKNLHRILDDIDIIEVFNGKIYLKYKNNNASEFAKENNILQGAGSDAHTVSEIFKTHIIINNFENKEDLLKNLKTAQIHKDTQKFFSLFKNAATRIKNKIIYGRGLRDK